MSKKIATIEKVEDAIAQLEKLGASPSADRVLDITGGSKSTVLPLYNQAMETRMTTVKSELANRLMAPPQELQEAVNKACKAITALPALFMGELSRYDRIIGHHAQGVLVRETSERDALISELQADLDLARRGEQEALKRIDALEHELALARKLVAALEKATNAREPAHIARDHAAVAPGGRPWTDHPEPFLVKPLASSNAPSRDCARSGADDDW